MGSGVCPCGVLGSDRPCGAGAGAVPAAVPANLRFCFDSEVSMHFTHMANTPDSLICGSPPRENTNCSVEFGVVISSSFLYHLSIKISFFTWR